MSKFSYGMVGLSVVCIAVDVFMMRYDPLFFGMCAVMLAAGVTLTLLGNSDNV